MSDARLTEALARLEEHHKLHLPLRRTDVFGRLALRFLWRRQLKWQMETNLATRDAIDAFKDVARAQQARLDHIGAAATTEQLQHELESLRRNDQNLMAGLNQRLYSAVGRVQTQLSDLRMQLGDRLSDNAETDLRIKAMEEQIGTLTAAAQDVRLRHVQLDLFLDELRSARPDRPGSEVLDTVGDRNDFIELAVSELLDGPADRVRTAREAHLSTVTAARSEGATGPVLDMAPGRGEWLEVLRAADVPYQSASVNPLIRRHSEGLGCPVAAGEPLDLLAAAPKRSLGAVTAFRYVERLDPALLARFVDLAAAALQQGGVLVIETPVVASEELNVDPFARRAVHPAFLQFLVDAAGFARFEVRPVAAEPLNRRPAALGTGGAETAGRYCLLAWR
jgi:hypothetical protein